MDETEILEKLKKLAPRQREVLELFCMGMDYSDIAKRLFITTGTVRKTISDIGEQLGIQDLSVNERKKKIFQVYCPVLQKLKPIDVEPINKEPKQTKEDQKVNKTKDHKKRKGCRWILYPVIVILIALTVFGGFKLYEFGRNFFHGLNAQSALEIPNGDETAQQTVQTQEIVNPTISSTKEVVFVPTNTELPPAPAQIKTPSPIVRLPFYDDFSNGIDSPWNVAVGKWIVTETGATISISEDDNETGSIILNDPTLIDYKVRVKVHTPHMWSAAQGQFGVIVRYGPNNDQNIIFYMDSNGRFKWSYTESLSDFSFYLDPITGVNKDLGDTNITLEIEVIGNTFIARVNGTKVDQFSMSGFEKGGIALMTKCGNPGSCPSFSDLSIETVN